MLRAVRQLLSEENSFSSSSSPTSLPPEIRAHLVSCAACAAEARAADPTLLLVPLAAAFSPALPQEDARRVTADVLAEVRRRARLTPPPARRLPARRLLQAAALVVLAAGLFGVGGGLARRDQGATPAPPVAASATGDARDPQAAGVPEAERASARPLIQDLKNPGARVYEFAAVSPKEPTVVFIADPHADL